MSADNGLECIWEWREIPKAERGSVCLGDSSLASKCLEDEHVGAPPALGLCSLPSKLHRWKCQRLNRQWFPSRHDAVQTICRQVMFSPDLLPFTWVCAIPASCRLGFVSVTEKKMSQSVNDGDGGADRAVSTSLEARGVSNVVPAGCEATLVMLYPAFTSTLAQKIYKSKWWPHRCAPVSAHAHACAHTYTVVSSVVTANPDIYKVKRCTNIFTCYKKHMSRCTTKCRGSHMVLVIDLRAKSNSSMQ